MTIMRGGIMRGGVMRGSVMRGGVMRSQWDWTPAQLFAGGWQGFYTDPVSGLYLFSDTAGTSPAPTDGTVARLDAPPGSPVAASFTNATAAQQPIRRADGLEFDGVDDRLRYPDNPALRFGTTDFTIAYSCIMDSLPATHCPISKRGAATVGTLPGWGVRHAVDDIYLEYDYPGQTGTYTYAVATNVLTVGGYFDIVIQLDRTARAATACVNDTQQPSATIPAVGDISGTQALVIGATPTLTYFLDGRLGRLLAINRLLTINERALVNAWLKAGHS